MSEPYPLPSFAAHIWIVGDKLMLGFPPTTGGEFGHSVALPATLAGMSAALAVLKERANAAVLYQKVGHKASPTQWNLERDKVYLAWLKQMQEDNAFTAKEKADAADMLKEIGL